MIHYFEKGITYLEYKNCIQLLLSKGQVSGDNQSQDLIDYTQLNLHRMDRVEKTFKPLTELIQNLTQIKVPYQWLVISEGWCGDAAQILPVLLKIADSSNGKITLKIVFRDENKELIDQFLTNGGRAIPKLLCFQQNNLKFVWGPRPKIAQDLVMEFKKNNPDNLKAYAEELHKWYAKDRGQEVQKEIIKLLSQ